MYQGLEGSLGAWRAAGCQRLWPVTSAPESAGHKIPSLLALGEEEGGSGGRSEVPAFSWSTVPRTAATEEKSGSIRREIDLYSSISWY